MPPAFRSFLFVAALATALSATSARAADDASLPEFGAAGRAFLEKYCIACHGADEPEAGLSLTGFRDSTSLVQGRKTWDFVLQRIAAGDMPPKDEPRPTLAEAEALSEQVRSIFEHYDLHAPPDPGRVTMRRLNRVEYRNTIRDLIGVDFDPTADFPSDDIGHGFDNVGDVLTMSPVLMERYIAASDQIMSQAILPKLPPVIKRHLASAYTEPASSESGKLVVNGFRPIRTNGEKPIELGPINTPYQWEPDGEYLFRTRVYAETAEDRPLKVTILVHGKDLSDPSPDAELDGLLGNVPRPARILKTFEIEAHARESAQTLEVSVPAMAGRHRMLVAIDAPAANAPPATLWVEYLALDGPLDPRPASQRRLLATPDGTPENERSRIVMSRFLRRAFRRPPTEDELSRSIELVEDVAAEEGSWEAGVQFAMQATLCSPKFLFRVELDQNPASAEVRDLDEFQLASRLSYFLWSSMPDDELLDLAERKELSASLEDQVRRMLADPRSSSLVGNFAMQWLQLKRIEFISPDGKLFPTFDAKLREAMVRETELFVESILREDRSVLELVDADYTFLNERLARHYNIADTNGNSIGSPADAPAGEPIRGREFVRVALRDGTRGGLLTQASVLTATSNPTRTSPVKRGRWTLEQILGAPPPPPPPDVPELPEADQDVKGASLRERMEIHRRDPACANCHAKMDAIGFALENFDAVGAWRTKEGEFEIDATGELPDGTTFSGPGELKALVLARKEEFVRCLTEKMLTYALGRGIEYYDRPTVERIASNVAAEEYRFSALVMQIVASDAFRQRRGLP